jgi:hypothetical protein
MSKGSTPPLNDLNPIIQFSKDGRPADEAKLKTCYTRHEAIKVRDFAFTHYAP